MKDSRSMISHLIKQPSFQKCEQIRCFERLLAVLPSTFTQWIKFLYIKNETLFFVLNHPCAKMEFNYKRNLIKSLLSALINHHPECESLRVKEIQSFVTNVKDEAPHLLTQNGAIVYPEQSKGTFKNHCENESLHALFETIRQDIAKEPC